MKPLYLSGTKFTPEIKFQDGLLSIKGRSIPEDSIKFYEQIYSWTDEYITTNTVDTVIMVQLSYFNTSSSKCLLDFLRKFSPLQKLGKKVNIQWYYEEEDDDMIESGEDYKDLVNANFDFIEIK